MNPLLLGPILEIGKSLIDRLFPDPSAKAAAELELLKLTTENDLKNVLAQLEINAREAAHPSLFVAGWRPFVGWCCGFGLCFASILYPMLVWLARVRGWPAPPTLDTDVLMYVLGAILGVGTLRTVEKTKGVSK